MARRTPRDARRRALGQNFLTDNGLADLLASSVFPGDIVLDFGAGRGILTLALAARGATVIAIEKDPVLFARLQRKITERDLDSQVDILEGDLRDCPLPQTPYRVVSNPPFNLTTTLLRRLLSDPAKGPEQADLLLQKEVARERARVPPRTMLSASWLPWWEFEFVRRVSRTAFRPVPRIDCAWLRITKRRLPLLPESAATPYAEFLRERWDEFVRTGGHRGVSGR